MSRVTVARKNTTMVATVIDKKLMTPTAAVVPATRFEDHGVLRTLYQEVQRTVKISQARFVHRQNC